MSPRTPPDSAYDEIADVLLSEADEVAVGAEGELDRAVAIIHHVFGEEHVEEVDE